MTKAKENHAQDPSKGHHWSGTPSDSIDRPISVFDFDGTLVRGDCFGAWLRWQIQSNLWRRALALFFAPFGLTMMAIKPLRVRGINGFVWIACMGFRDEADFKQSYSRYLDGMADLQAWRIQPVFEALHARIAKGERVVIATGAEKILAQTLWQRLGGAPVPWIASSLKPFGPSWIAKEHTVGRQKLAALQAAGFAPPFAAGYSDSIQDLPMLMASEQVFLVTSTTQNLDVLSRRVQIAGMDATRIAHVQYDKDATI